MLWKKETDQNDSIYVDIFEEHGGKAFFRKISSDAKQGKANSTMLKNDEISLKMRNEGNEYFKKDKWIQAIELYGESLCCAENESINVSLAYGNRSACFFKLKQYDECLIDIELAKEAGYPVKLMPKLNRRKEECLKAIEEGEPSIKIGLKLSMAANEQFPCMANVLKYDRDANGNLGVFAKEDIDVGQTIVAEKGLVNYLYWRPGWKCNICLKERTNLVPCKKCTAAMFCYNKCQFDPLHEYECGLRYSDNPLVNGTTLQTVRSCLMAIDMFSSVEELMKFVEQAISTDPNQIPSNFLNKKSQYEAFLKLPLDPANRKAENFQCILVVSYSAQKMLLKIPKINSMFNSKKNRRFLMHFVIHHHQVLEFNSIQSCISAVDQPNIAYQLLMTQTGLMSGHNKHCCSPNVMIRKSPDDTFALVTVRPITKGQQIFYSELSELLTLTKPERHELLWRQRKKVCKCALCEGVAASKTLCKRIRSDPDYQCITSQSNTTSRDDDQTMIDKCERFLRKYGRSPWSIEFGRVVLAYMELLNQHVHHKEV